MKTEKKIAAKLEELRQTLIDDNVVKNKTDFAAQLGTYTGAFAAIVKGERKPNVDLLIQVLNRFQKYITPNMLFGFDAPNNIQFLTEANAGASIASDDYNGSSSFAIPGLEGDLVAFPVKGDSMLPTINSGDVLICKKDISMREVKENEIYIIESQEGINVKRVVIKRIDNKVAGITLLSDNHMFHPPIEVDFSEGLHGIPFIKFHRPIRRITSI